MFSKLLFRLLLTASLIIFGSIQNTFADETTTDTSINALQPTKSTVHTQQSAATIKANITSSMSQKININTANIKALMSIKGIGEAKAKAIIDYREKHGKFITLHELTNVKGIGDGILKRAESFIKLS